MIKALIVNIGDELLIGQVVNTNSSYIAKQLNLLGIQVSKIEVIADDEEAILNTLHAAQQYDLVIITGGLGPTKDDITKTTLAKFMNDQLVQDKIVLQDIENLLKSKKREMNELNRLQAQVLSRCRVIRNFLGTAPGMIMKKNHTTYVSLPGVPFEMKPMLNEALNTFISEHPSEKIIHKTILVFGIPESDLSIKLEKWENQLSKDGIKLAYLPSRNFVRLRLSVYEKNENAERLIDKYISELKLILGKHYVGEESFETGTENPLAKVLVDKLTEKHYTLSFAESCTGGAIASAITKIPGASQVFMGSVVSYDNSIKENVLNVKRETLQTYGAVSKECVEEMAKGVKNLMKTDVALSVSGIAGPTGGTKEKPVGTVWMALYFKETMETKLVSVVPQSREYIIETAVFNALAWILKRIMEE